MAESIMATKVGLDVILGEHSYCTKPIEFWEPIVRVGNYTAIAHPCTFMGAANHPSVLEGNHNLVPNYPFNNVPCGMSYHINYPKCGGKKEINIGNDVWVGYDCIFLAKVTVGDGAIIGMRSVVTSDIPPYSIAVGSPCKPVKYRFSQDIIDKLLKIKWWDWPHMTIIKRIEDLKDINKFIEKYGN